MPVCNTHSADAFEVSLTNSALKGNHIQTLYQKIAENAHRITLTTTGFPLFRTDKIPGFSSTLRDILLF